jgi:hypothetical protein
MATFGCFRFVILALMNLFLHGVEPHIALGDTIYEPDRGDRFDCILTNRPSALRARTRRQTATTSQSRRMHRNYLSQELAGKVATFQSIQTHGPIHRQAFSGWRRGRPGSTTPPGERGPTS